MLAGIVVLVIVSSIPAGTLVLSWQRGYRVEVVITFMFLNFYYWPCKIIMVFFIISASLKFVPMFYCDEILVMQYAFADFGLNYNDFKL